jgi:peptidoglycan/xylan/chitin deacetylase (PgdA/CDA1 family)
MNIEPTKKRPFILMYHGIKTDLQSVPDDREKGAELYDVSLDRFEAQMTWLSNNNYRTIIVDELDSYSQERQIVLTFDDGEMNNFIHALPILKRLNFKAYFFAIVERIGKPGYMGWAELHQLHEAGMIIGSHSLTHSILTNLMPPQLEEELYDSLRCLESHLGTVISTLSIPRGFCNDKVIQAAYEAGYRNVFISERPEHLKIDCWERMAIKASWNIQKFKKAIDGEKSVSEQIFDSVKRIAKKFLSEVAYNRLRNAIISISFKKRVNKMNA